MKEYLKIGIVVYPNCTASMITGVWDILSLANEFNRNNKNRKPFFSLALIAENNLAISTFSGLSFTPHKNIKTKEVFDIIYIPGFMGEVDSTITLNKKIINWISQLDADKTIITAACNGNFLLAASGKLENKSATTHWSLINKMRTDYDKIRLCPEKIIVDNGNIISAAGVTSYFNLALHLIQRFMGSEISLSCAKVFLVDAGRKIQTPYQMFEFSKSHGDDLIKKAQDWIESNYTVNITISKLESVVNCSGKTLTRRFRKATGLSPFAYIQKLRIETAKRLLESKDMTFNEVTWDVGYNDSSSFHKAFKLETGLTPNEYRLKFSIL
jgi:transcriptional regulator GlxA family with amidase domain